MARISQLLSRLRRDPLADLPLSDRVNQLLDEQKIVWRERLLPPLVTLSLFLIQIAHGNCAIAALRQLSGIAFAVSSYCEARARLPLQLLQGLLEWVRDAAAAHVAATARFAGRILVVDGSTYSMPGSPELAAHFHLPQQTKPGVGYPTGKLMGLLYAAIADESRDAAGRAAGEWKSAGFWYLAGSNTCIYSNPREELGATGHNVQTSNRRFRDDEFIVPRELTRGKDKIRVRVKFLPDPTPLFPGHPLADQAWSEISYTAYCWVMPQWNAGSR